MSSELFDSANLLLDRARENRDELDRRSKAFVDGSPCFNVVERDPQSGFFLHKAKLAQVPGFLFPIAADAFNNLRHTLDQAICGSALAMDPAVDLRGISFPFGSNEVAFETNLKTTAKKIAPEIVATLRIIKPYKGGNDRLWALGNLSNMNKHRSLIALGASVKSMTVNSLTMFGAAPAISPVWDAKKGELIIAITERSEPLGYNVDVDFYIALGDVEVWRGWHALDAIDWLTSMVRAILVGVESQTQQLYPSS